MSISNEDNRPQLGRWIGDISATSKIFVLHTHKDLYIRKVSLVSNTARAAGTNTNHVTFRLINRNSSGTETNIGTAAVTTEDNATPLGSALDLNVPDNLVLRKGSSLLLQATVVGNGEFDDAFVSVDAQVRGS